MRPGDSAGRRRWPHREQGATPRIRSSRLWAPSQRPGRDRPAGAGTRGDGRRWGPDPPTGWQRCESGCRPRTAGCFSRTGRRRRDRRQSSPLLRRRPRRLAPGSASPRGVGSGTHRRGRVRRRLDRRVRQGEPPRRRICAEPAGDGSRHRGCRDAFAAALALGPVRGDDHETALRRACAVGAAAVEDERSRPELLPLDRY